MVEKKKGFTMVLMVDLHLNISKEYKLTFTYNFKNLLKLPTEKLVFLRLIFHILDVMIIRKETLAYCINLSGAETSI